LRVYNKLIITLVVVLSLINIILAFLGQKQIEIYFVINAIAYLIITLLYTHLNPRARVALSAMSAVIFAGFLVIVTVKVIEILK
jgi:hypothetical protein